ncbi:MAG: methyltransferase family protein [Anaerolineae bacterium]
MRLVVVLRLLGLAAVSPLLLYLINPQWVSWARLSLPHWVRMAAAIVAIGTVPVIYWIFSTLGNSISPTEATREGHTLVTHGPYRWVRHPLYSVGVLFYLSLSLVTALWWLPLASLPALILLVRRTEAEEANLIAAFGDDYRGYMQQTGRFLPGVGASG